MKKTESNRSDRRNTAKYPAVQDGSDPGPLYNCRIQEDIMVTMDGFADRLASLRTAKQVSAREMSLSLGQGAGYINNIENGHNLPSMTAFFDICEYLQISPADFFAYGTETDETIRPALEELAKLSPAAREAMTTLLKELNKK